MTKKIYILFFLIGWFYSLELVAQDKLLFLNGKQLEGSLIEKTNYEFTFKDKNEKEFIIDKYRVFSFTQNNIENIVYEFDTLSGNFLKVEDMKMFVYGERDAHKTYKPIFSSSIGFAIGATGGYFMHKNDDFVYVTLPFGYTLTTLLFPTKVRQHKLTETKYIKEDEYLRGYERIARSRRTQNALKSSVVGMGVGFLVSFLINNSSEE